MLNKELTVGQLAARSGVAVTALHFYESKGLIKSNRNAGNQRRYPGGGQCGQQRVGHANTQG